MAQVAQCGHREQLGCRRVCTVSSRLGRGLGGNSGRCSSDLNNKVYEEQQQLLVPGSQLVPRAPRQLQSPHCAPWTAKSGPSTEGTRPGSQGELC